MTRPVTAPGRLVAERYRLQTQIGGGGMGAVWLARDELLGRQVAVKQVLLSETDAELAEQQRLRALREGRIAARLSHPHAISVYDVAQEGETPWLVMEYLPSRSLAAVLTEDGVLRVDQVAQIGAQVADALAATHEAGIVHRDVKPGNILIGQGDRLDGLVKITDFGISHASGDVTLTQTGQITGTPAFLAPEVAQGHEMTEASDVFSLGATLYTCLEGQPPFGMEENALAMLHRVAGGSIRPPVRAGSLAQPLTRMLAVDPAARPSMTEVRDELVKHAAGHGGDTTTVLLARTDLRPAGGRALTEPEPAPAPAPVAPPRERHSRRRGLWVAAAVLAVALAGLVAFLLIPDGDDGGTQAQDPPPTAEEPTTAPDPEPADGEQGGGEQGGGNPAAETQDGANPDGSGNAGDSGQGDGEPLTADAIERFLEDYHEQVLEDPAATWDRTGPTLRANISRENYIDYWNQFSDVRVRDVQATDGANQAMATLEYRYDDGRRESGSHVFTFLVEDGRLVLDSDFPA
ncbi:serine/threonine-protein kinase [Blastococcus sp. CCUG 61487]|uniref:serine/threonine-protein kinase n=1 Tax=Blastococcus sp. CCUG 61487 TaxID=1840703 RepID=UPI0010BFA2E5|nr:serine/threonine-protein kinase [Blastococcus sp. CCUG 61487]TKJ32260.1 hypothetical protein A6V29_17115 [Blastococcus sp. CCUG 61487]